MGPLPYHGATSRSYKSDVVLQAERHCMIGAYYRRLTSEDEETRKNAAKIWSRWELSTSRLYPDEEFIKKADGDLWSQQFARIEW